MVIVGTTLIATNTCGISLPAGEWAPPCYPTFFFLLYFFFALVIISALLFTSFTQHVREKRPKKRNINRLGSSEHKQILKLSSSFNSKGETKDQLSRWPLKQGGVQVF